MRNLVQCRRTASRAVIIGCLVRLTHFSSEAAVHFVDVNSTSASPPYTDWATAAQDIQSAVDAATAGDTVLVTNGAYATGGRVVYGTMTNRVVIDRAILVQSVNGPSVTVIEGAHAPGTTNGDGAIRGAYLTNGAMLSGFTVRNGATRVPYGLTEQEAAGGGLWCQSASAVVSNCVIIRNSAYYWGGGVYGGTLYGCVLSTNSSGSGGAAYSSILNNCTLTGNWAHYGGALYSCTAINCELTGNAAIGNDYGGHGGGAYIGALSHCTLNGNTAFWNGGGAAGSTLNNCTLTANTATLNGGGVSSATLTNCVLTRNISGQLGGGADSGTLNNCSLTANIATHGGGGAYDSVLNNCIVYYNTAPTPTANYSGGTLNYCCTTPQPLAGAGNISLDPQVADASHLSVASPCRGAGSAVYASGTDIDGEAWAAQPSIGSDEYVPVSVMGTLSVGILAARTNVAPGFPLDFTGIVYGHAGASAWDFGDGVIVSNQPFTSHVWSAPGNYLVKFIAYNQSNPGGASAQVAVRVISSPVHFVAAGSATPVPPYTNWATAAADIQSAVDVAEVGALVLVNDGVYATGGRAVYGTMTNRVAIDRPITVRSVNGPGVTVVQGAHAPVGTNGDGAIRCVYLGNGASLIGFTLTHGATQVRPFAAESERNGGGIWCEPFSGVVSNCFLIGNSAIVGGGAFGGNLYSCTLIGNAVTTACGKCDAGGIGGGAHSATLNNCLLTNNSAAYGGGGAYNARLTNCTIAGNAALYSYGGGGGVGSSTLDSCNLIANRADQGGGAYGGTLNNCTLVRNFAPTGGGGALSATLVNCALLSNSTPASGWGVPSGGGAHNCALDRCVLMGNVAYSGAGAYGSVLSNCTLTGNSTRGNVPMEGAPPSFGPGGGAAQSTLINCTITANSASVGGGVDHCTLNNCRLTGNTASLSTYDVGGGGGMSFGTASNCVLTGNAAYSGGGGYNATLVNCTLTGNSAYFGGGTYNGTLNNCISYFNTATNLGPNYTNSAFNYCCTTPLPSTGAGNITNPPAFMDYPGGNLRLQSNSPCINAGNNAYAIGGRDRDGRPRIVGGRVDIGAFEFQSETLNQFLFWLEQNGLPTAGSADFADPDGDGLNNWQEWVLGINPTNALSALRLLTPVRTAGGFVVSWQSVTNRIYFLQRSTNLAQGFVMLATNLPGQAGFTAYTDTAALGAGPYFYRVGVRAPGPLSVSIIPYAWLLQYNLPTDGSADFADTDGDGLSNWQEWRAGTDPTDGQSALRMIAAIPGPAGISVSWRSVPGRNYFVQRASILPGFQTLQGNLAGQTNTTTWLDSGGGTGGPLFYRVGVQ